MDWIMRILLRLTVCVDFMDIEAEIEMADIQIMVVQRSGLEPFSTYLLRGWLALSISDRVSAQACAAGPYAG